MKKLKLHHVLIVIIAFVFFINVGYGNNVEAATITFIQFKGADVIANSNSVSTGNLNSAVTNTNLIIAWIWYNSNSQSVSSVTDTKGNIYAKVIGPTTGAGGLGSWRQELWYAKNVTGGTGFNVTANFSSTFSAEKSITAHEYSGIDTVSPLDVSVATVTSVSNASTSSVTTTFPNELIFGVAIFSGSGSADASFTQRSSIAANASEDKVVSSIGSYSAIFHNNAQDAVLQMATFKASGAPPPPPDTTPPTVSITAPVNLSTVNGSSVTVSANASDNVGVAGVQFLLDGANLGLENTTSPYSITWNTTTTTDGAHVISARARDAAGNTATAANVNVTVDNTAPSGSVIINSGAAATNSTASTLTLSAADALSAVTQMRFSNTGSSFSAAEAYAITKAWTLATGDGTKTVYVQFMDVAGNWSLSFIDTIILDTTAPTISAVVSSNIATNSATITWTTDEPATSQVEYGPTVSYGSITTIDNTLNVSHSVSLTGLSPSTSYNYRVRSIDALGNERIDINNTFTTAAIVDTTPPTVPTNFTANPVSVSQINLSWTASTDNVGVVGYKLFRGGTQIATVTTGVSYSDINLSPNTLYSYTILAYDAANNNSAQSSPVSAITLPDTTPPTVSISSPLNNSIVSGIVSVIANVSDNVGVAGVTFKVDNINIAPEDTTAPYSVNLDTVTLIDGSHTLTAIARDTSNNTATSVPVTIYVDTTPPSVPTNLQSSNITSSSVTISWTASTDNITVAGYKVYRNGIQVGTSLTTSYSDTGLTSNTTYSYTVSAYDSSNNVSAQSAPLNITTLSSLFPLTLSPNSRYLKDQNSQPFPILGRSAWFLTSLSTIDYQTFINDTASRGYNAVELLAVNHDPRGNNPPFNGNGSLPFLKKLDATNWSGALTYANINTEAPDFTTPNDIYWTSVDALISYCESKGIEVFMFPAYVGYQGGNQGWMQEIVANGTAKIQTYGAWIANRYKNYKNIVWMMGGDMGTGSSSFSQTQTNIENALITGLKSVAGQQSTFFSAEWNSPSIGTDQVTFGSQMSLNSVYNWSGDVKTYGRNAYSYSPVEPAFLLEEPYDQEGPDGNGVNPNATQPVRRFQWWGWLSTIEGYMSGNGYVWPFVSPNWQNHLDTQGSRDMGRLNAFIKSISWSNLVPSGLNGMKTLITAGGGTVSSSDYVSAVATVDKTLLVAYVPPAHTGNITVDMTAMVASTQARWYNPTDGTYSTVSGSPFPNTGTIQFTPPGNNGTGYTDWVLVLNSSFVPDTTPPSVPTSLTATAISSSQINLSWTASTDNVAVTGYQVFRNGLQIATTAQINFNDTGLTPSTSYSYTVLAFDGSGNLSAQSFPASATTFTIDTTPPTVPTNFTANPVSVSQINLSWTASTDNVGVVGYKLFRGGTQIATVTTGVSYSDINLSPNTLYSYTILAYDAANNNSAQSSPVSAITLPDTTPPSIPTSLTATAISSSQINLSWTASTDNVAVTGYKIFRGGIQVGTSTTNNFSDTGLTSNTTYSYAVSAYDAAGNNSAQSSSVSATTLSTSTLVLAINSGGVAAGSFMADANFTGGYTYKNSNAINTSNVTNPAPQAVYQSERYGNITYTIPNLTPGALYTVRLHFAEIYASAAGQRLFNTSINGQQVLTNFDIFAVAGGKNIANIQQFGVIADGTGKITIQFTTLKDNAKVSGIEITTP